MIFYAVKRIFPLQESDSRQHLVVLVILPEINGVIYIPASHDHVTTCCLATRRKFIKELLNQQTRRMYGGLPERKEEYGLKVHAS